MTTLRNAPNRGNCLDPTSLALLGDPLNFIHEDHLREREICAALDRLASGAAPYDDDGMRSLSFLQNELPLHLADEEEDLFPLLRRRCEREDEIDRVIARMSADHRHAETESPRVIAILLGRERGGAALGPEDAAILLRYSAAARRHLIFENAIILPFARLRLTGDDLETLRLRMMQRRGLDRLMEAEIA